MWWRVWEGGALRPFDMGDHRMSVRGRVWLDPVRDAGGEVCVESVEGVCELGVDLIDTCVEYGMESCEEP